MALVETQLHQTRGAGRVLCRALSILLAALAFMVLPLKLVAAAENPEGSVPKVSGARVAGDEIRTRFVLDLDREVTPAVSALADPYRLIIDFPELDFGLSPEAGTSGRGLVSAWRYGLFAEGKSRIVLDVDGPVAVDKTFLLPAIDDQPVRLVVDIVKSTRDQFLVFAEESRAQRHTRESRPSGKSDKLARPGDRDRPLVVLDPGHGGIDTGAVGVGGTLEKAVVLDFSILLKQKLEETGRYEVMLTRDDDTFIPLGERVQFGHDVAADLFISIHADSVRRGRTVVRGASVYTLSDRASDALAQELADRENRSDIIAGVELSRETDDVTDILVDLARRETRNFSVHFARTLVSELESAVRLIKNPHRSAGFIVLKAHDVPSVLVELGYLSNEHDEKLLVSDAWRERMANAMVAAVDGFFRPRFAREGATPVQ